MAYRFYQLAFDSTGQWIAGAKHQIGEKGDVRVATYRLPVGKKVAEFRTIFAMGGERLAISGGEFPVVVAAGWSTRGVAAYDGLTGNLLWKNKDVEEVQGVAIDDFDRVVVECERLSCTHIDLHTGATIERFRGVREMHVIDQSVAIAQTRSEVGVFELATKRWRWKRKVGGIGFLAGNKEMIAVSNWSAFDMYDIHGGHLRHIDCPTNSHFIQLTAVNGVQGTLYQVNHARRPRRFWFGTDGQTIAEESVPRKIFGFGCAFGTGSLFATMEGEIYKLSALQRQLILPA